MYLKLLRDFQRERVYVWEDEFVVDDDEKVPRKYLRELFFWLCVKFDVTGSLTFRDHEISLHDEGKILLCRKHEKVSVLLHEFTHLIIWDMCEDADILHVPHGREWLSLYIILLNRVMGYDLLELITSAKKHKLKLNIQQVMKYGRKTRYSIQA